MEEVLLKLFERATHEVPGTLSGRYYRDEFILTCTRRLTASLHAEDCARFMRDEIASHSAVLVAAKADPEFNVTTNKIAVREYRLYDYTIAEWIAAAKE